MNDRIKQDLLRLIDQALFSIEQHDVNKLKDISNYVIHNAAVFQDPMSVQMIIIIYSLSKIMFKNPKLDSDIVQMLKRAHTLLYDDKTDAYNGVMHQLYKKISEADSQISQYITEVISRSQVRKGQSIYEHGISIGRAAELMGISQWELLSYIGKVKEPEQYEEGPSAQKRLNYARRLFNLGGES